MAGLVCLSGRLQHYIRLDASALLALEILGAQDSDTEGSGLGRWCTHTSRESRGSLAARYAGCHLAQLGRLANLSSRDIVCLRRTCGRVDRVALSVRRDEHLFA